MCSSTSANITSRCAKQCPSFRCLHIYCWKDFIIHDRYRLGFGECCTASDSLARRKKKFEGVEVSSGRGHALNSNSTPPDILNFTPSKILLLAMLTQKRSLGPRERELHDHDRDDAAEALHSMRLRIRMDKAFQPVCIANLHSGHCRGSNRTRHSV